ncbi:MAG: hypothetical protein ACR2MB_01775 [Acidimicrobiales bacterium]
MTASRKKQHNDLEGENAAAPVPEPHAEGDQGRSGLEHLQAAALEMIAASRAMLDAAEQVVADPKAAGSVVDLLGSVAGLARGRRPGSDRNAPGHDDDPPVQHIPVS